MTKINLLPHREQARPRVTPRKLITIVVLELIVVGASALYAYRHFSIVQMEKEVRQVQAQLASMQQDMDVLTKVQMRSKEIQILIDEARAIKSEGIASGRVLREVRRILPQDVWLSSLSAAPERIIAVDAAAFSLESVARAALAMEASPLFSGVRVGSMKLSMAGDARVYAFDVECAVEPGR
ncbi:MAG: PilN domain-containing protein [Clostridia bacterium]|nr:PilN domain-containing protein [Clostridia bacterium]